jgi:hypothetical protein
VFQDGLVTFSSDNLVKAASIRNKNFTTTPADSLEMSAVVVANFDVSAKTFNLSFPHTGTWYEYYTGDELTVSAATQTVNLTAGEYRVYTNTPLVSPVITSVTAEQPSLLLYPNPIVNYLESVEVLQQVTLISTTGIKYSLHQLNTYQWDTSGVPAGFYVAISVKDGVLTKNKILKR